MSSIQLAQSSGRRQQPPGSPASAKQTTPQCELAAPGHQRDRPPSRPSLTGRREPGGLLTRECRHARSAGVRPIERPANSESKSRLTAPSQTPYSRHGGRRGRPGPSGPETSSPLKARLRMPGAVCPAGRALQGRCNRRRDARVAGKAGELEGSGSRPCSRTSQVPRAGSLRLAHRSRCRGSMSIAATSVATGITWRSRETPSAASVPAHASPSTTAPMNRTARPRLERRSRRSRIVGTVNLSAGHQG